MYAVTILNGDFENSKILCVATVVSITNGMFLSLLQTCLISVQRYLVIGHTEWNNRLFQNNRKYFVCLCSWLIIFVFTFGLISPSDENLLELQGLCSTAYVYSQHYVIFNAFTKFSILFLVVTIVLYCLTIRNVVKMNRQIVPQHHVQNVRQRATGLQPENPENSQNTSTNFRHRRIAWAHPDDVLLSTQPPRARYHPVEELPGGRSVPATEEHPSGRSVSTTEERPDGGFLLAAEELPGARSARTAEESVEMRPPIITQHAQMEAIRRKKIVNTVVLVGILLAFFILLSGPLIISPVFPELPPVYVTIATGLCFLNSLTNPFVYCWKLPEVKDALIQFFRKVFRCS
jgi:hypothetical protein